LFAKHKTSKKQTLRNNEYYDMQKVFDQLNSQPVQGKLFHRLLDIITSKTTFCLLTEISKEIRGAKQAE